MAVVLFGVFGVVRGSLRCDLGWFQVVPESIRASKARTQWWLCVAFETHQNLVD